MHAIEIRQVGKWIAGALALLLVPGTLPIALIALACRQFSARRARAAAAL